MSNFRKNFLTFLVCVILSLLIHITMLFGLSGYKGFSFLTSQDEESISVSLRDEGAKKTLLASNKPLPLKPFAKKPESSQHGDTDNTGGAENDPSSDESANAVLPSDVSHSSGGNNTAASGPVQMASYSREKLSYDIYWMGIYAGKAVLEAENKNGIFRITSRVQSAPVISAFYKVEDFAESIVTNGLPFKLRLKLQEGTHTSDKETVFDMGNRKITFINYLKGKKKEYDIPNDSVWDILSGFYFLRTQKLDAGKTAYVDIFDSNKFFRAEVNILRKETLQISGLGEVSTLVIKPELKSEGLFKKTGDILIWLTDDDRKIPVRVETRIPVGNVVAELKGIEIID
jgi:Protein of unknown function (DUF3108)